MKKIMTVAAMAAMCAALAAAPAFARGGHDAMRGGASSNEASSEDSVKITRLTGVTAKAPLSDESVLPEDASSVPAAKLRPARVEKNDSQSGESTASDEENSAKREEIRAKLDELKTRYEAAETDEEKEAVSAEIKELVKDIPRMSRLPHKDAPALDSEDAEKLAELKEALKSAETDEEKQEISEAIKSICPKADADSGHKFTGRRHGDSSVKPNKGASSDGSRDVPAENEADSSVSEDSDFEVSFDYDFGEAV